MNNKSYVFGNEDEGQNFTETYNIGEDFLITQTKTSWLAYRNYVAGSKSSKVATSKAVFFICKMTC